MIRSSFNIISPHFSPTIGVFTARCFRRQFSSAAPQVITLEPGLYHIKNAFTLQEQVELTRHAMAMGNDKENGFYNEDGKLNCINRGRIYDKLTAFPEPLRNVSDRLMNIMTGHDPSFKTVKPTHGIALFYPPKAFIPWHQDNGDNDGIGEEYVFSLSLGYPCDFLICHGKPEIDSKHPLSNPRNLAHRVRLNTGDGFAFGRKKGRKIWHAILEIFPTCPKELFFLKGRLSFTYRPTPHLFGLEKLFAKIPSSTKERDRFYKFAKAEKKL